MKIHRMCEEVRKSSSWLSDIHRHLIATVEILVRLLNLEDENNIDVTEWGIINSELYITFDTGCELEHDLPADEQALVDSLARLFPECKIEGTKITIYKSSLIY